MHTSPVSAVLDALPPELASLEPSLDDVFAPLAPSPILALRGYLVLHGAHEAYWDGPFMPMRAIAREDIDALDCTPMATAAEVAQVPGLFTAIGAASYAFKDAPGVLDTVWRRHARHVAPRDPLLVHITPFGLYLHATYDNKGFEGMLDILEEHAPYRTDTAPDVPAALARVQQQWDFPLFGLALLRQGGSAHDRAKVYARMRDLVAPLVEGMADLSFQPTFTGLVASADSRIPAP